MEEERPLEEAQLLPKRQLRSRGRPKRKAQQRGRHRNTEDEGS